MKDKFKIIHTMSSDVRKKNPQWNMPYVPAIKVKCGKPMYISGVNAAPIYHSHPHQEGEFNDLDFTPRGQAKQTMDNLSAILRAASGSMDDIVQLFVFIVNIREHGDIVSKVIASYFKQHMPTSTVIGVNDLITDSRLIVEVTATAYLDEG